MATLIVRRATDADAPALAALRFEFRAAHGDATEGEAAFVDRCERWMTARLRDPGHWCAWVAERDGAMLGTVWLMVFAKIPNPVREPEEHAYLTNFYVRDSERGTGVGTRLLGKAVEWGRERRVDAMFLWPTARSRPLYERAGFAVRDDVMQLRP